MSTGKALIVDDNDSIRRLVVRVLQRSEVETEEASEGASALQKLAAEDYDVVVLDLMMPGQSGFDVIRELRKKRPEVLKRLIVMTAAAGKTTEGIEQDVCAVVTKPFSITDLTDVVIRCIRDVTERREDRETGRP